jgi:hypothetical protein
MTTPRQKQPRGVFWRGIPIAPEIFGFLCANVIVKAAPAWSPRITGTDESVTP